MGQHLINKLKTIRKNKGLTQADVANKLNIDMRTYRRYEIGESSITLDLLNRIAQALDVTPCDLIAPGNDNARALIHYFNKLTQQDQDYFFTKIKALALEQSRA